ncbi:hypothetical protein [Chlorobium sp.]|jgi:hypothetical protein|uniref:hypothetical protein n=1 Tax=Chlorobium sp. TaxID=1095 RepID=UPI003C6137E2|nr:hypothetical protein [Chlorobiaceae bacterium]NTW94189.1 hypothetical protein [Chlorobiaceae bacterium]
MPKTSPQFLENMKLMYSLQEQLLIKKWRVMYLYPPPEGLDMSQIRVLIAKGVDEKFTKAVKTHLQQYMLEGKEPPAAIAATIRNFADDVVMGREIVVRAGDYISVQSFLNKAK